MISIILPTYNSMEFLEERVLTILNQSYKKWECVVIDGESSDGTWEYLGSLADADPRFKLFSMPPKGVYNAWNEGVKKSSGEYVYFATSDDTMDSNCLLKMENALSVHPECSIAHCNLHIINSEGNLMSDLDWFKFPAQEYFGEWVNLKHIRMAPLSALLYINFQTVIHSFTQVLLKRVVFDKIGFFQENQGPKADYEWGMRALLTENLVHIPEVLATWRVHENQLTSAHSKPISIFNEFQRFSIHHSALNSSAKNRLEKNLLIFNALDQRTAFSRRSVTEKLLSVNFWKVRRFLKEYPALEGTEDKKVFFNAAFEYVLGYPSSDCIRSVKD